MLAHFLLDGFTEVAGGGLFAIIGCWGSPCCLICRSYRKTPSPQLWLLCRKEKDKARKSQGGPGSVYTWFWHGGCCVAWIQSISLTIHNEGPGREASPGRLFIEKGKKEQVRSQNMALCWLGKFGIFAWSCATRAWVCDKGRVYNKYSWTSTAWVVLAQVGLNDEEEISTDAGVACWQKSYLCWFVGRRVPFREEGSFSWLFFFFFQISFSLQKIQDHEVLDVLGRAVSSCLWCSGACTSSGWLDGEVVSTWSSFLGRCVDSCPPRTGLTCAS